MNYDSWDRSGGSNLLGYWDTSFDGYGDDLKPRNNKMEIDPVLPRVLIPRGTVLIGRRWRANQRAGLRWRNRKRDPGEAA